VSVLFFSKKTVGVKAPHTRFIVYDNIMLKRLSLQLPSSRGCPLLYHRGITTPTRSGLLLVRRCCTHGDDWCVHNETQRTFFKLLCRRRQTKIKKGVVASYALYRYVRIVIVRRLHHYILLYYIKYIMLRICLRFVTF